MPPYNPNSTAPVGLSGSTSGDYEYANTLTNNFRTQAQLDSEANLQADRASSDYTKMYQKIAESYVKQRNSSKNNASSRGMLGSGAHVKNLGELAKQNIENVDSTTQSSQRYFEDLSRQTASRKTAAEQVRLQAETQQAQIKAQMDLQRALSEAQTKQYSDLIAGLSGQGAQSAQNTQNTQNTQNIQNNYGSNYAGYAPEAIGTSQQWDGNGWQNVIQLS